jgi:tetratricopeptide (TPR) repeat protein
MAAIALRNRAGALFIAGDHAASVTAYREAAAEAGRAEDVRLRLDCRWGEAEGLAELRNWPAVLAICEEIVPQMREYDIDERLARTLLVRARAEYFLDDEESALETAGAAAEEFQRVGDIPGHVWAQDFVVTVLLFLGRTAEAVVTARNNHRVSTSLADDGAEPYHRRRLGEALLANDEAEAAAEAFAAAQAVYRRRGRPARSAEAQSWLGRTYDRLGRTADAVAALSEAVAVLEAAGPRSTFERDRARRQLADIHFESGADAQAIAEYRTLLGPVLAGTAPTEWRHAWPLERLTAALVREERAAEAREGLAALRMGDGVDPLVVVIVEACRCWARWHTDGPAAAGPDAESLLAHPALGRAGLAQAWVMEMVGRQAGSVAHLARALVLYAEHDDVGSSFAMGRAILEHTSGLLPEVAAD